MKRLSITLFAFTMLLGCYTQIFPPVTESVQNNTDNYYRQSDDYSHFIFPMSQDYLWSFTTWQSPFRFNDPFLYPYGYDFYRYYYNRGFNYYNPYLYNNGYYGFPDYYYSYNVYPGWNNDGNEEGKSGNTNNQVPGRSFPVRERERKGNNPRDTFIPSPMQFVPATTASSGENSTSSNVPPVTSSTTQNQNLKSSQQDKPKTESKKNIRNSGKNNESSSSGRELKRRQRTPHTTKTDSFKSSTDKKKIPVSEKNKKKDL